MSNEINELRRYLGGLQRLSMEDVMRIIDAFEREVDRLEEKLNSIGGKDGLE